MKKRRDKAPVDPGTLPYRPCVGVVVINREGRVWAGRRIPETDTELAGSAKLWQWPQGGIDKGEDALAAARRELYEETGMRTVSLLGETPDWLTYDLPPHLVGLAFKGKYRGQKQKWFCFRFEGEESEIAVDPPPDGHAPEFDTWAWKPIDEMPELIVPFKRDVYEQVVAAFRPLARPA